MKKLLSGSVLILVTLFLSGCGNKINPDDAKGTISFLQNHFDITEEAEKDPVESEGEIQTIYYLGDDVTIHLNDQDSVVGIFVTDIDAEGVKDFYKAVRFSTTEEIKNYINAGPLTENTLTFENAEDKNMTTMLYKKTDNEKEFTGDKEFGLSLFFLPDEKNEITQ